MVLIGLWHGVTWNFVLWGLWHGLGLFVQNRWSEWVQPRLKALGWTGAPGFSRRCRPAVFYSPFIMFALGWVWFALPSPELALGVLARLFGV